MAICATTSRAAAVAHRSKSDRSARPSVGAAQVSATGAPASSVAFGRSERRRPAPDL